MANELTREVDAAVSRINTAWLNGRVDDLYPLLHADVVMAFPGFSGSMQGREPFLAGFRDFCQNATVREFHEHDRQVHVCGNTAVATFRFEMVYERGGQRSRSAGRDLWVLQNDGGAWTAVWRAMLDVEESPA